VIIQIEEGVWSRLSEQVRGAFLKKPYTRIQLFRTRLGKDYVLYKDVWFLNTSGIPSGAIEVK